MTSPTGVRIDEFAGVFGRSTTVSRPPHPGLRAHVRGYVGYSEFTSFHRRREVPNGAVTVIIDLGSGLRLIEPGSRGVRVGQFVVGPTDHAGIVDSGGQQTGLQVNLSLLGARRLLNLPLVEISNRAVPLEEVFGAAGTRLVEQLHATPAWSDRFALMDAALTARLDGAADPPADLARAWGLLDQCAGACSVTDLAAEIGCSRKHLTTRFARELGIPPKRLAGILRFRRAVDQLAGGTDLARLAAACGYFDQAHLNRDFRRFAGITPTEHLQMFTPEFGLRAD
ncbi:MAG TPA: helix-turn-helix domain-containing protein [Mycobacteriales bacterium]|nr:helix-turn-helix domain-containing protein [Mycobacteriales bacterium]